MKFEKIKKCLYFMKYNILFDKALREGKIEKFDEEIFEKMSGTIIACLPVDLYIRHSNYLFANGTCYDRSLYMFLALDDALLVRGNNKQLEYNYGVGYEGHGWIEIGDFVYDPSLMLRFDKDTYYALYEISNVNKIDKESYLLEHKDFVDMVVSNDFSDFMPGGKRRLDLGTYIIQIKSLSELIGDVRFIDDVNNYLTKIKYDEDEINEERKRIIKKI